MSKSRIFLLILLFFLGGIAVRSFVPLSIGIIGAGFFIVLVFLLFGFFQKNRNMILITLLGCALLLGVLRYSAVEVTRPDPSALLGQTLDIRGVITKEPVETEKSQQLIVQTNTEKPFFISVVTRRYPAYALGDEIEIKGKLEAPEKRGDFDYPSYLASQDIFAVMAFPELQKIGEGRGNKFFLMLSELKHQFERNIEQALPEPHASFLEGLLLGERKSLPADLQEEFKLTGTTHMIALSGYNITIVSRFFLLVLMLLSFPFVFSFWVTLLGIIFFILLTGASASLVRAGIMGILVLVAEREGRLYQATNALVFAGALMVLQNPTILRFDTAFQLSFLSTIGLFYVAPYLERRFARVFCVLKFNTRQGRKEKKSGLLETVKKTFIETLSAQFMVLPLVIYLFGRVSLISPLANIAVLIAVPYAMGVGFVAGMAGFLSTYLAWAIGSLAWLILSYMLFTVSFFSRIPYAALEIGSWIIVPLLCFYALLFWKMKKERDHSLSVTRHP